MTDYRALCAQLVDELACQSWNDESDVLTTDYRALCAQLVDELACQSWNDESDVLINRARAALAEPESSDGSGLITVSGQIGCPRLSSGVPATFRWGRRNGALVLQVGYAWRQGAEHGVDWKDVPTVDLDNEAQP